MNVPFALPRLTEEQDAIRTTAVKGNTAALVGAKLVPEPKNGNGKFVPMPNVDRAKHDRSVCGIKPLEEQVVLLAVTDARHKSTQVLEHSQEDQLNR